MISSALRNLVSALYKILSSSQPPPCSPLTLGFVPAWNSPLLRVSGVIIGSVPRYSAINDQQKHLRYRWFGRWYSVACMKWVRSSALRNCRYGSCKVWQRIKQKLHQTYQPVPCCWPVHPQRNRECSLRVAKHVDEVPGLSRTVCILKSRWNTQEVTGIGENH